MRVRDGANLNYSFQIWAIFSHPCTAYRQQIFCVQSLLDSIFKEEKFQARFRPDKPDHFPLQVEVKILGRNYKLTEFPITEVNKVNIMKEWECILSKTEFRIVVHENK
jgi:hypothetical protein